MTGTEFLILIMIVCGMFCLPRILEFLWDMLGGGRRK